MTNYKPTPIQYDAQDRLIAGHGFEMEAICCGPCGDAMPKGYLNFQVTIKRGSINWSQLVQELSNHPPRLGDLMVNALNDAARYRQDPECTDFLAKGWGRTLEDYQRCFGCFEGLTRLGVNKAEYHELINSSDRVMFGFQMTEELDKQDAERLEVEFKALMAEPSKGTDADGDTRGSQRD